MAAFSFFALTMTTMVSNLSAADLPQDIDRNQLRDGLQDRLKDESLRQRAIEHESMTRPDVSPTVNQPDDSLEVEDKVGPHCFDIKETQVKGHADAVKVPSGYSDLIGSLLTYIGSELPGFSTDGLLFTPATLTATADSQGGMSLVYDKNSSTSQEKSRSSDVNVNAGIGLNLFGLFNLGGHYTQSTNHNKSVHVTQNLDYSLTFH